MQKQVKHQSQVQGKRKLALLHPPIPRKGEKVKTEIHPTPSFSLWTKREKI